MDRNINTIRAKHYMLPKKIRVEEAAAAVLQWLLKHQIKKML